MTTRLSPEQQQQIDLHGGKPIEVVHPGTQKVYVLIAGDLYDKLRPLFDDEFNIRDTYAAQDGALAKIWADPALDAYNNYDAHRPQ